MFEVLITVIAGKNFFIRIDEEKIEAPLRVALMKIANSGGDPAKEIMRLAEKAAHDENRP